MKLRARLDSGARRTWSERGYTPSAGSEILEGDRGISGRPALRRPLISALHLVAAQSSLRKASLSSPVVPVKVPGLTLRVGILDLISVARGWNTPLAG